MAKEKIVSVDNVSKKSKRMSKPHQKKLAKRGERDSVKINESVGPLIENAKENYEFNTKSLIPDNMKVGFKDGDEKNVKFSNLVLVYKDSNAPVHGADLQGLEKSQPGKFRKEKVEKKKKKEKEKAKEELKEEVKKELKAEKKKK